MRADKLEPAIMGEIARMLSTPEAVLFELRRRLDDSHSSFDAEAASPVIEETAHELH